MLFLLYVWNHCFWQVWLQNKSICNVLIKLSLRGLWYLRNNALRISIMYPLLYIIALNVMIESIKCLIKIFYHLAFQMQGETCLRGHDNLSTNVTCTCNYMLSNFFFLLLSLLSFISLSITNAMILQQTLIHNAARSQWRIKQSNQANAF